MNNSLNLRTSTPPKLNSSPFNQSTTKINMFKSPTTSIIYSIPQPSEKVKAFFAGKEIEEECKPITPEKAIDVLNILYSNGLNKYNSLIYGSVAHWLQNTQYKKTIFGDIDIAVSHVHPKIAACEFVQILDKCKFEYLLTGNTFSIIDDDHSFYNIQMVTREEKNAFPKSVLYDKNNFFEEIAKKEIIHDGKKYYCINEKFLNSETSTLPLYIKDNIEPKSILNKKNLGNIRNIFALNVDSSNFNPSSIFKIGPLLLK